MGSAYVAGAFGLVGALLGGLITGLISLRVARESRTTAEQAWIRDSRRGVYDRYLTSGQRMHIACEDLKDHLDAPRKVRHRTLGVSPKTGVSSARINLMEVYGVVQTVAERAVVDAARDYGYRLLALHSILVKTPGAMRMEHFDKASELARDARQDTIDAMREELRLTGSAKPSKSYDPFANTDLAGRWQRTPR